MSADRSVPPSGQPSTPPDYSKPVSHQDWILNQLNRVDREVGMLTTSVKSQEKQLDELVSAAKETTKSLNKIHITIAFSAGALVVIVAAAGYFFDKRFDQIFSLLAQ